MADKDYRDNTDRLGDRFGDAMRPMRPAGDCPGAEELAALADGKVSTREREELLGHMATCERCRTVYSMVADEAYEAREEVPAAPARTRAWTFRRLVPAALAACVAIAAAYMLLVSPGGRVDKKAMQVAMNDAVHQAIPESAPEETMKDEGSPALGSVAPATASRKAPEPAPASKDKGLEPEAQSYIAGAPSAAPEEGSLKKSITAPAAPAAKPENGTESRLYAAAEAQPTAEPSRGMKSEAPPPVEARAGEVSPSPSCSEEAGICTVPATPMPATTQAGGNAVAAGKADETALKRTEEGTLKSMDMEKMTIVFLPDGAESPVTIEVSDKKYLAVVKPGDRIKVYYEAGNMKVAARLKPVRATIPAAVGC